LRTIRAQIVESGVPLLSDAELEQEIADRRGDRNVNSTKFFFKVSPLGSPMWSH
jgi:hypothetical protein